MSRALALHYKLKAQSAEAMALSHDKASQAALLDPLLSRTEQTTAFTAEIKQRDACRQRAHELYALAAAP